MPRNAEEYERCKATHRCPRAYTQYNITDASVIFESAAFGDGDREHAHLFADFEDWQQGTRFWGADSTNGAHFSSFDYELLGPLAAPRLNPDGDHSIYNLTFNTSSLNMTMYNETSDELLYWQTGELVSTPNGTEVALFNFDYIDLGNNVYIDTTGPRALCLLSRSSIRFGSRINIEPETLGGFPGSNSVSENNQQGPGSSSQRVYLFTVQTQATRIKEVQTVTTFADAGQTLRGGFRVRYRDGTSHTIPCNASPGLFKARLERATRTVGQVSVSRSLADDQGGFTWTITYDTATGNLPQLEVESELEGIGAGINSTTLQDANELGGEFALSFHNDTTKLLPFNVSSYDMVTALEQLEGVIFASVQRSDAITDGRALVLPGYGACDNGLCPHDSPGPSRELIWTILLVTSTGNVAPTSPTVANIDEIGPILNLTIGINELTGLDASINVTIGHHTLYHAQSFTGLANISSPFSFAFGGIGGSYGGLGMLSSPVTLTQSRLLKDASLNLTISKILSVASKMQNPAYGTADLSRDLLGGSGGGVGGINLRHLLAHSPPAGIGGAGGGALEIVAVNDIIFESTSGLDVSGGDGQSAFWGGGGGSGGSILIVAGGIIQLDPNCTIVADGGSGGASAAFPDGIRANGSGGRIAMYAKAMTLDRNEVSNLIHASPNGSVNIYTRFGPQLNLDHTRGAAGTTSSLRLEVEEFTTTQSGIKKRSPFAANGPRFDIHPDTNSGTLPNRVAAYVMMRRIDMGSSVDIRSTGVALYASASIEDEPVMIGAAVKNGNFVHGASYRNSPENIFYHKVMQNRWYKLEFLIDWDTSTYTIRLDDVERVVDAPFNGTDFQSIGLHGYSGATSWFDEVYAGHDDSAYFRCPRMIMHEAPDDDAEVTRAERRSGASLVMNRPDQTEWDSSWRGPNSSYTAMVHHESHLSDRALYQGHSHDLVYYSGGQNLRYNSDVGPLEPASRAGKVYRGVLLGTPSSPGSEVSEDILEATETTAGGNGRDWSNGYDTENATINDGEDATTGRYYWYGEHINPRAAEEPLLRGGVMSCSTNDFMTWRNEGTMLHFVNISYDGGVPRTSIYVVDNVEEGDTNDLRYSVEIPVEEIVGVGNWTNAPLVLERPKVLYNKNNNQYVMWGNVHDEANELGVALVATSDYPGGPYSIYNVSLPNGNETHDQTVIQRDDGKALLIRTYYATVDYLLPEPVMQPMWESVKDEYGDVDYGLNYHRATYLEGYDDANDICIQRVRMEDKEANIIYTPLDERMPVVDWIRNAYSGEGYLEHYSVSEQAEPWIYKNITGQGDPVVESRFLRPTLDINNYWMPSSVPAVKAQPWKYNYRDDNIADNPIHTALPDKLIGPPQVVQQRRTKYIAISLLSDDYLEAIDDLSIMEGYMEEGIDLASIISNPDQLGTNLEDQAVPYDRRNFPEICIGGDGDDEWETCNAAFELTQKSTMPGQVWGLNASFDFVTEKDWAWRYHQYRTVKGDRDDAPINFRDQLVPWFTPGSGKSRSTRGRSFFRAYDYNCYRGENNYTEDDPNYVAADDLYLHILSQHWRKTEGIDNSTVTAHLVEWDGIPKNQTLD